MAFTDGPAEQIGRGNLVLNAPSGGAVIGKALIVIAGSGDEWDLGFGASGAVIGSAVIGSAVIGGGSSPSSPAVNQYFPVVPDAGNARTLALTDAGKYLRVSGTASIARTMPADDDVDWPDDTEMILEQSGTNVIELVAGAGVQLLSAGNLSTTTRYETLTLKRVGPNTWIVGGGSAVGGGGSVTNPNFTVATGAAGSSVSITGTYPNLTLTIPRGDTGAAGTNGINGTNGSNGTNAANPNFSVATGAAGSSVVLTGTYPNLTLTIPRGDTGATGATGPAGPNSVSNTTSTTLVGILKGDGSLVSAVATTGSGSVVLAVQPILDAPFITSKTFATVNALVASSYTNCLISVSDRGGRLCYSDGTNFRWHSTGARIAETPSHQIQIKIPDTTVGAKQLFLEIPFALTITGWKLVANVSGSLVVDLWKDTYANFPPTVADTITGSAKPTLSSAQRATSSTLTGWTPALNQGDILELNVDSVSAITNATLILYCDRA